MKKVLIVIWIEDDPKWDSLELKKTLNEKELEEDPNEIGLMEDDPKWDGDGRGP